MITRKCVICGDNFLCYPSDNKVTCSRECRCERQRRIVKKRPVQWGEEAKKRLSEKGQTKNLILGSDAAKKSPVSGRFQTNKAAKVWTLISPEGEIIVARNLLMWARENTELFGKPPCDKSAIQIASGFKAIAQTLKRNRGVPGKRRGSLSYFGWGLKEPPVSPSD